MQTKTVAIVNPLAGLREQGQSVWLDYIRRSLITGGELQRLIHDDGLLGITSNPTIFEKAIAGSADYDNSLRDILARMPDANSRTLFEMLAIEDIRMAADMLRPVYEQAGGRDGFVSLEVSPTLARDTSGTIAEARRLWQAVSRPNLLIKVPATAEGIPAIEALVGEGISVNVTLMFSLAHYEAVAWAYIRGLEHCANPALVNSVASFFVSRVDTAVDKALEAKGSNDALALRGQIAVANSRQVYRRFREIFDGAAFAPLRRRGAAVQRPLWASTGTKDPAYSDVKYVEELIGPDTVNTMPPATMSAFRDHGRVQGATVKEGAPDRVLARLAKLGIDLDAAAERLQAEGVASFEASFAELLAALDKKRQAILAGQVDQQVLSLGAIQAAVDRRLGVWQKSSFACRLWRKDPTLWSPEKNAPEIANRLGWLTLPEAMHGQIGELDSFAEEIRKEGFRHVVLLGMGGSSLAPEVYQRTFGSARGYPELVVLDSTHPAAIRAVRNRIDAAHTLFLVSSKSGTTIEPLSFFRYFWSLLPQDPGRHFVAITDPGTSLVTLARERKFRRVFEAPPDVGGRYSALSVFGLVPAALIGVDLRKLLGGAWTMAEACSFCVGTSENPGMVLGAALGELALAGRDKVTFLASPALASLPDWMEQLIAESTGKSGTGILPVAGETPGLQESYGRDRLFVELCVEGEPAPAPVPTGYPSIRIALPSKIDIGQEFFRWEVATAAAGAVLGIHPFNQPDVQFAKELAHKAIEKGAGRSMQPAEPDLYAVDADALGPAIQSWIGQARDGHYIALQAYLAPTVETTAALTDIRRALRDRTRLATTLGYGPRFLHSTGQLHKGGSKTGLFLQLVDAPADDLQVPESGFTFGALIRAQASGDAAALGQREQKVLRVNLGSDVPAGFGLLRKRLNV